MREIRDKDVNLVHRLLRATEPALKLGSCTSPETSITLMWSRLADMRVGVRWTTDPRPALTLRNWIFLPDRFYRLDDRSATKAKWLAHECAHAVQWRALGRVKFAVFYARQESRWAIEVAAEAFAQRVARVVGMPERARQIHISGFAAALADPDGTHRMSRLHGVEKATKSMLEALCL